MSLRLFQPHGVHVFERREPRRLLEPARALHSAMSGNLRSVFVATNEASAQQTQAFLDAFGIRSVRRHRTAPARLFGLTLRGREAVEILVDAADEVEARELLAQAEAGAFRLGDDEDGR